MNPLGANGNDPFFSKLQQDIETEERIRQEPTASPDAAVMRPTPPPVAAEEDPFFADLRQQEANNVTVALQLAERVDPERAAAAKRIAERDGILFESAVEKIGELKRREQISEVRLELEKNPKLRDVFTRGLNSTVMDVTDLQRASGVEWLAGSASAAWNSSWTQQEVNRRRSQQMDGKLPKDDPETNRLEQMLQAQGPLGDDGPLDTMWTGVVGQLPVLMKAAQMAFAGGTVGAAVGSAIPGAGTGAGGVVGAGTGTFINAYDQLRGEAYGEILRIRGMGNEQIDDQTAVVLAAAVGSLGAALETGSLAVLAAPARAMVRSMVRGALQSPTLRTGLLTYARTAGIQVGTEVGTEVAQQGMQIAAEEFAKGTAAGDFFARTAGQIAGELTETARQTALTMVPFAAVGASPTLRRGFQDVQLAQRNQEVVRQLAEQAEQFQLAKRSPETADELIRESVRGTGIETVFVPATALQETLNQANVPMAELERTIPGISEQIAEGLRLGTDVAIPFEVYHNRVVVDPRIGPALIEQTKFDERLPTIAQIKTEIAGLERDEQLTDAQLAQRAADEARVEETRAETLATIRQELQAAGVEPRLAEQNAIIMTEYAITQAERRGVPVEAVLATMPRVATAGVQAGRAPQATLMQRARAAVSAAISRDASSRNLQEFAAGSVASNPDGTPRVMYHGTTRAFRAFRPNDRGLIFITDSPRAAQAFGEAESVPNKQGVVKGSQILPVYVRATNPFDFDRGELVDAVVEGLDLDAFNKGNKSPARDLAEVRQRIADGSWKAIENRETLRRIRELGHDSIYVSEGRVKNLAVFEPGQIKSVFNRGTFDLGQADILNQVVTSRLGVVDNSTDPETGDNPNRISTRQPTSKKSTEDAIRDNLIVGLESSMADPKNFAKNVELIRAYPNMPVVEGETDVETAERFIEHVRSNLLWLHDLYDAEYRQRTRLWYDGARAITDRWTAKYGLPETAIGGVLAALSPQKDWYQNVSLGERVLDIYTGEQDTAWTPEMQVTADRIFPRMWPEGAKLKGKQREGEAYAKLRDALDGKTLREFGDNDQLAAMWLRVFDETYHSKSYRIVTPEGDWGDFAKTKDGSNQKVAWGSSVEIGKAIAVIRDPSRENVSRAMGAKHKVRNFYNNIVAPKAPHGDVTIDTHAVAAGLLRPLAGKSTEVEHNFGGPGSALTGSEGTYGIYAEAYRRAAADRGVLAREMQSITWEAVRTLFTAEFKNAKNVNAVDAIWGEYRDGTISLEEARDRTAAYAGGIGKPEWADTPARPDGADADAARASSYERDLPAARLPGSASVGIQPTAGGRAGGRATLPLAAQAVTLNQEIAGQITFGDAQPVIQLFAAANASTLPHELAHFMLRSHQAWALSNPDNAQAQADWQAIRAFLGMDGDTMTVEQEEKWARTFEAYLMEGKAPSAELRDVFARFAAWLRIVYRSISNLYTAGAAEVTPEVREVMDRMLASDEAIADAQGQVAFRPMPREAFRGNEVQYARYVDQVQAANEAAEDRMRERLMRDITRRTTVEWREARKALEEDVRDELQRLPVHIVRKLLIDGEDYEGFMAQSGKDYVLDYNDILASHGQDVADTLQKQGVAVRTSTKRDVISAEMLAEMFDWPTGDALITELYLTPPIKEHVQQVTDERMVERFGEMARDIELQIDQAQLALHSDERGDLLEQELGQLADAAGLAGTGTPRAIAKAVAEQRVAAMKVRDVRPARFLAAERRAARETEDAVLAGDFRKAADAKRRQMYAHEMALAADRAQENTRRALKYLKKFEREKRPAGVAFAYLDQIDRLLSRFSLRTNTQAQQQVLDVGIMQYVLELDQQGIVTSIDPKILDEAFRANWREMAVEDFMALRDAVRQLDYTGRQVRKLEVEGIKREREEVIAELVAAAGAVRQRKRLDPRFDTWSGLKENFLTMAASLLRIEQLVDWLDGGPKGPWRSAIFNRIADAQVREMDMQERYTGELIKVFEGLDPKYMAEKIHVQDADVTMTRSQLYAFALNTGNESNLDKMLRGEANSPHGIDSPTKLQALLSHMRKEDWDRVQQIWDTIEGLWPELAALQRRLTGVEPPKIQAREVITPYGTYRGGYYPMVYDPRMSERAAENEAEATERLMADSAFIRPVVESGARKERTGFAAPISTDLRVIASHVNKVIHDITHWEAVRDTWALVNDPRVGQAVKDVVGNEQYRAMKQWVNRVANDRNMAPNTGFEFLITGLRQKISLVAMGFRLSTIITQFVGFSNSMEHVTPVNMGRAFRQWAKNPAAAHREVSRLSGEMRHRFTTLERDVREAMRTALGDTGNLAKVQRMAFYGIGMADRVVSEVTWLGAYNQALQAGETQDVAIRLGDRAVRLSQGAGAAKDISALQADRKVWSLFTMFYSYFNLYFNRLWNTGRDVRTMIDQGSYAVDMPNIIARVMAHTIIPAVMADILLFRGPDEDEIEEEGRLGAYATWGAQKVLLYPFASLPIIRDVAKEVDFALEKGKAPEFSGNIPWARPLTEAGRLGYQLWNTAVEGEDLDGRQALKRATLTAGYALGLPVGQLATTGDAIWQRLEGEDVVWHEYAFGKRPK